MRVLDDLTVLMFNGFPSRDVLCDSTTDTLLVQCKDGELCEVLGLVDCCEGVRDRLVLCVGFEPLR